MKLQTCVLTKDDVVRMNEFRKKWMKQVKEVMDKNPFKKKPKVSKKLIAIVAGIVVVLAFLGVGARKCRWPR